MNLEQFKNATVGKSIGFNGSYGECGGYASYWFSELTGDKYQFAYGKPNINAQWAIGSDCYTAWRDRMPGSSRNLPPSDRRRPALPFSYHVACFHNCRSRCSNMLT